VINVDGFPQYGEQISAEQREKLRLPAAGVALLLAGGASVRVSIYGHADFDQKKTPQQIYEISYNRAKYARETLQAVLLEEGAKLLVPAARLQTVQYEIQGLGNSMPRVQGFDPRNRRVEFVWAVSPPAPVPQQSVFDRCNKVLAGAGPPGPVRRMTCACTKFLQAPATQDSHYDFRASRNLIPGSAGMPNLTPEQWDAAIRGMVHHMKQDISNVAQGASDPDFSRSLMTLDDTVGRNINDFYSQLNAGGATGLFDRVIVGDIQARMADPNHVYSCYANYSRATHNQ
jgi:hypothetical protein